MEKRKSGFSIFKLIVSILLIVYCVGLLFLVLYAFNVSLFSEMELDTANRMQFTQSFSFKNYIAVLDDLYVPAAGLVPATGILEMFYNSIVYTAGSALCQVACTVVVAYVTARVNCLFSRIIHASVLVAVILPIVGATASQLQIFQFLNIFDTMFGMYFMRFGFINMYYFVFHAAFMAISWEYAESAFIDGASHLRVFLQIMLPLVSTMIGIVWLMYFVQYWNDYQIPLTFMPSRYTAAYGLYYFQNVLNPKPILSLQFAGGFLLALPTFAAFMVFKDKLMGNLTSGGIKG